MQLGADNDTLSGWNSTGSSTAEEVELWADIALIAVSTVYSLFSICFFSFQFLIGWVAHATSGWFYRWCVPDWLIGWARRRAGG